MIRGKSLKALQSTLYGLRLSGLVALISGLFLIAAFICDVQAASFQGKHISSIEIIVQKGEPDRDLLRLISMRPGDPYTYRGVRDAMQSLIAEGLGRDVLVDAVEDGAGVRLAFIIVPNVVVTSVSVTGNRVLSVKKIRKTILLKEGEEFSAWRKKKSLESLEERYRQVGYLGVVVTISDSEDEGGRKVMVSVNEGQQVKIGSIIFSGEKALSDTELSILSTIKEGAPYTRKSVDKMREALQKAYLAKGYVQAKVGTPLIHTLPSVEGVGLEFPINAGERLNVSFKGNRAYSNKQLKKELPFQESRNISEGGVQEATETILNFYRKKGYYRASVQSLINRDAGVVNVELEINEGINYHLDKLTFEGNRTISNEDLRADVSLREKSLFTPGVFTDDALEHDLESIKWLYADRGFLNAGIVKRQLDIDAGKIRVVVGIDEGIRTMVSGTSIKGNTAIGSSQLEKILSTRNGQPYSPRRARDDRYRLISRYANIGYIYAEVLVEEVFSETKDSVEVVYTIKEDKPVKVGRIRIKGLDLVRPKIVKREISVREGETYNYEQILSDQSQVYKTGLFSSARFEPVDSPERTYVKDLVMAVKEKNAGAVEVGVGYGDEERFRGIFDISHKNLWGLNRYLGFRGEVSAIESKYTLSFKEPRLFNKTYDFQASAFKQQLERKEYDLDITGVSAGIEKKWGDTWRISILYQLESADVSRVKPDAVLREEDTGRINIGSFLGSVTWDTRDNPLDPGKGFLNGVTYKIATAETGSEIDFYKLTAQSSWYYSPVSRTTLALSGRVGISETFNGDVQLPISERFFIGGRNTVRGYSLDTLGPKGSGGSPTGGNAMVILNAELRFPIKGDLAGALFVDSGNVWQSVGGFDVSDIKSTVGAGIFYRTPVGPLRLDYAAKLDREPGESSGEWHFTLGYAF